MKMFYAILNNRIQVTDILGAERVFPIGSRVEVSVAIVQLVGTTLYGEHTIEPPGSYIGTIEDVSFDLEEADFTRLT